MPNQRGFGAIIFIAILAAVSVGVVGGAFFIKQMRPAPHVEVKNNSYTLKGRIVDAKDKYRVYMAWVTVGKQKTETNEQGDFILSNVSANDNKIIVEPNYLYIPYEGKIDFNSAVNGVITMTIELSFTPEVEQANKKLEDCVNDPQCRARLQEGTAEGRDVSRLADLAGLKSGIDAAIKIATVSGATLYCKGGTFPCRGSSLTDNRNSDGTGWIKMDLQVQLESSIPQLPLDYHESGSTMNHYTYCATQNGWEIDTVLESNKYSDRMASDSGDDPNKYEIGSSLSLIDKTPGCQF